MRLLGSILAAASATFFVGFANASTFGVGGPVTPTDATNWSITCSDERACRGTIVVTNQENDVRLATIQVLVEQDTDTQGMAIVVPLGLAIEPGIRILADDKTYDADLAVCFPDGCRVVVPLSTSEFRELLFQSSMQLQYFAYQADRPVSFEVDLGGLKEELTKAAPGRSDLFAE